MDDFEDYYAPTRTEEQGVLTDPTSNEGPKKSNRWKTLMPLMACIGLVMLAAGITGLFLAKQKDDKEESAVDSSRSTPSDWELTDDDALPIGEVSSLRKVRSFLLNRKISSLQDLTNTSTPQFRAMDWLTYQDPHRQPLPTTPQEEYLYMTRYVMTVNYFSLGGDKWDTDLGFLLNASTCEWSGPVYTDTNISEASVPTDEYGGLLCNGDNVPVALDLEFNNVQGSLPSENGLLTTLQVIELRGNAIVGSISTELCQLQDLRHLSLGNNQMTGRLPACSWPKLEYMHVEVNELTGSIPSEWCGMPALEHLVVQRNQLTGNLLVCDEWQDSLVELVASNNLLEGTIPANLGSFPALAQLWLDDNTLSGNPISVLNQLSQLESLHLGSNQFTGIIDDAFLANAKQLQALDVSNNQFTSTNFPPHLLEFPELLVLDLNRNNLQGYLPSSVPTNSVLRFFSVYKNALQGSIPATIANLNGLWHLDLSSNSFTGLLPSDIFSDNIYNLLLADLPTLQQGLLPKSIDNLVNLEELSLRNSNRLGPLPEFSSTEYLYLVDLSENKFTSTIPGSYSDLMLSYLFLGQNSIEGTVPPLVVDILELENTALFGDLSCTNVTMAIVPCNHVFSSCPCCQCCEDCISDDSVHLDWTWEGEFDREWDLVDESKLTPAR